MQNAQATLNRRRFQPPRTLKVTRSGKVYLVLTVGMGIGALNTGNNLLYLVVGLMLSLIIASGLFSERCLKNIRIRRVGADEAHAGEAFIYRYTISNAEAAGYAMSVHEKDADVQVSASIGYLRRGVTATLRGQGAPSKRGPHAVNTIRITTVFPLGLFAKSRDVDLPGEIIVFPARTTIADDLPVARADLEGEAADPRTGGNGEVAGLVAHHPDDDARRISWLKSASLGQWVRVERERFSHHVRWLDVSVGKEEQRGDAACEVAAAMGQRWLEEGCPVGLRVNGEEIPPGYGLVQERRILTALAWAGFEHLREAS